MNNSTATTDDAWNRSSGSPSDYDIPKDIDSVHEICNLYLRELRRIVTIPSSFALTAVMGYVSFLSNLAYSENSMDSKTKGLNEGDKFKRFVEEWVWPNQGRTAEIKALYHVLRCGLAHSMSFYGDNSVIKQFLAREKKKKKRTPLDCRQKLLSDDSFLHDFHASFPKVIIVNDATAVNKTAGGYDVCPSALLRDVEKATGEFFMAAKPGSKLESQILGYVRIQPPIVPLNDYSFIQNGDA